MADVVMPRLSDSMEEGTILRWLVSEGDSVSRGQPLVEIETDKANMTYESDSDGVLSEIVADEGDTLPVGEVIARFGGGGEDDGAGAKPPKDEEADEAEEKVGDERESQGVKPLGADSDPKASRDGAKGAGERVKASPVARRIAEEKGVDLGDVEGSGPGGRIVKADVEQAAEAAPSQAAETASRAEPAGAERGEADREAEPAGAERGEAERAGAKGEVTVKELTRLQRTVARRMAESKATVPDFQLDVEVDMTLCRELRERLRNVEDPAPSFNDMVVKTCGHALREFPRVNGAYRDGRWELYGRVNVGIAVAAKEALVVPTVFDADSKSLGQIARDARELIAKVRDGTITPPELAGGTFTVSNLGMYGIERFTAIVNPPQAATLAVGAVRKKAVANDRGRVQVRDMMAATLICDHRILYGADGAEFLARVRELLEQPASLAL